jgi:YbgC/YbaW family acyl-CoA thioester hydrolase
MARMKIEMPDNWAYSIEIEVRVSDLNYGNHLANQQFLSYAQEARVRFFAKYNFTELDFGGTALIQADAAITFKGEGHLGDVVVIEVATEKTGSSSFNVYYKFTNKTKSKSMAEIRTAIVCFDYEKGKPVAISERALDSGIFT